MVEDFEPEGRLHPLSWLFGVMTFVRQFLLPLLAAAFFGSKDGMPAWLGFAIIPMIGAAVWKQMFYRYGCGPNGLAIREGIIFHTIRQIDYGRIENIDTERNLLHRLLGVAEVRVETSTGGKPEALIQVLSLGDADALRESIFAARTVKVESTEATPEEETLLHLPLAEIVRFGLIDNRGMVVVAGLFGLAYETGVMEAWSSMVKNTFSPEQFDSIVDLGLPLQAAVALGALVLAFGVLRLFSVALALFTLHDFRLTQVGSDLRVRYGLLTRVALTLRLPRIQTVHQTETLLHRWFGRVSLRVDLAGDGAGTEQDQGSPTRVRWLAPVVPGQRAATLTARALPDVQLSTPPDWQPLAAGAQRRIFRKSLGWWTVSACSLALVLRTYTPLLLLVIGAAVSMWYATMYVRYTRWALLPDALMFRSGWLTRKLVIVPRNRVQCALTQESPFDRRHRMATLAIDTAGTGHRADTIGIPYLDAHTASDLAHSLYLTSAIGLSHSIAEVEAV